MWSFKLVKDRLQHGHTPLATRFFVLVMTPLSARLLYSARLARAFAAAVDSLA